MIQNFTILHRPKPALLQSPEFPVWTTCLRSLGFPLGERFSAQEHDELYSGIEAYRFLLEVICGLKSPMAGETEVFGQFKNFARDLVEHQPARSSLVQRLLSDAKAVRSEHLSHLGTQSYGSWIKKNLKADRVHVIGAGQLAGEILPYLMKQAKHVSIHARSLDRVNLQASAVHTLKERGFDRGALIVAAPMSAAEIELWLSGRHPSEIIDLRDTSNSDPVDGAHPLHDIFAEIERNKIHLQPRLEAARREITGRSIKAADLSLVRPQGWDDICA